MPLLLWLLSDLLLYESDELFMDALELFWKSHKDLKTTLTEVPGYYMTTTTMMMLLGTTDVCHDDGDDDGAVLFG